MAQSPPEGFPRMTPYLIYNDVSAALDWLAKAFGFDQRMSMPGPDGKIMHAEMQIADAVIMMGPPSDEAETKSPQDLSAVNQSVFCFVDDVDAHYEQAKRAGATITSEPADMFWGDRTCVLEDLEGHRWTFAKKVRDVAPEDMAPPA